MRKTIFITAFHSFITKNFLNTEAFKLITVNKELRIVLLVPEIKKQFFEDLYRGENVSIEPLSVTTLTNTRSARFFSRWGYLLLDSMYLRYKKHERLKARKNLKGYLKFLAEMTLAKIMSGGRFPHAVFRTLFLKYVTSSEIRGVFNRYHPAVVFSADAFDEMDTLVAAEAKRRKIKLISMVRSWDNCYSKGLLRVVPNKLIVNNHTLKSEAAEMHDMPENEIAIVGLPQHDLFVNRERTPREEFFSSMGLNPNKKLVIFAPAGSILSNTDGQVVQIFKEAIDEGKFKFQVQFLIRNHPNHPADLSAISGREDMVVENPGQVFNPKNPKDTELTRNDTEHMADELYYADVVVWVATTLPLDALVFDKPLISVDFDGYEDRPYYESVQRYHDEDHMKKMLDLGGVSIAKNPPELIEMINRYLKNPLQDKEGREKIRQQQFYKLDGQAGQRIGEYLLSEI